ncbi:MAG: Rrf2 family transcriptional regulator [Myxococcota bacterium]
MNSQLTIAAHILGVLAHRDGKPVTSDALAQTFGTNPVVIRRVLSQLKQAGLIDSRRGQGGGSVLARAPKDINLRHAYEAITAADDTLFRRHPGRCAHGVAPIIAGYINDLYADAEQAFLRRLEAVTVAEMNREIIRRVGGAPPLNGCD